jgi:hypothetical protein
MTTLWSTKVEGHLKIRSKDSKEDRIKGFWWTGKKKFRYSLDVRVQTSDNVDGPYHSITSYHKVESSFSVTSS